MEHKSLHATILALSAVAIIAILFFRTELNFEINSPETQDDVITVSGEGKVYAIPDVLELAVSVSKNDKKSNVSWEYVQGKSKEIKDILKKYNVEEKNIQTTYLSINPNHYTPDGIYLKTPTFTTTQSLSIRVEELQDKTDIASQIIDDMASIPDVLIDSINFDIKDKTELYTQARELAYKKAYQKAKELTALGDLKIVSTKNINEGGRSPYPYARTMQNQAFAEQDASAVANTGALFTGQMEITSNLEVVYEVE